MSNTNELEIKNLIMNKVKSGELKMKPKWYFIAGSIISFIGLIGSLFGLIFLTNLTMFLIHKKGPGIGRINSMLESFPLWIPILAILFIVTGYILLRRYEFSYKNNRYIIIVAVVSAILISSLLINILGLDEIWFKRGPMRNIDWNSNVYKIGKNNNLHRLN